MKKIHIMSAIGGATLASAMLVGAVAAAGPTASPGATAGATTGTSTTTVDCMHDGDGAGARWMGGAQGGDSALESILKLTSDQIHDYRADGLSLAQIAQKQGVDPQKLIDALVAQWSERIDARVANGALTTAQATELKAKLAEQAKTMVNSTDAVGMRGAAVGAGPNGAMRGMGMGGGMGGRMHGVDSDD